MVLPPKGKEHKRCLTIRTFMPQRTLRKPKVSTPTVDKVESDPPKHTSEVILVPAGNEIEKRFRELVSKMDKQVCLTR